MAAVLRILYNYYSDIVDYYADPRTENFFLAQNALLPLGIIIVYLQFVRKWGPRLMKNRPAFNLNKIMVAYNLLQIFLSLRFFLLGCKYTYFFGSYSFRCEPVDYSNSYMGLYIASEVHNYYLIKLLDLMDTVFFVLRKKQKQVTFLHLYHHVAMVLASWIGVRFVPGGHVLFIGYMNTFVHSIMYSYYTLAIFNNSASIWWKKYMTLLQIFQFGIIAFQWALMMMTENCGFPKMWGVILLPQNLFLTLMFIEFYYNSYVKNKKSNTI